MLYLALTILAHFTFSLCASDECGPRAYSEKQLIESVEGIILSSDLTFRLPLSSSAQERARHFSRISSYSFSKPKKATLFGNVPLKKLTKLKGRNTIITSIINYVASWYCVVMTTPIVPAEAYLRETTTYAFSEFVRRARFFIATLCKKKGVAAVDVSLLNLLTNAPLFEHYKAILEHKSTSAWAHKASGGLLSIPRAAEWAEKILFSLPLIYGDCKGQGDYKALNVFIKTVTAKYRMACENTAYSEADKLILGATIQELHDSLQRLIQDDSDGYRVNIVPLQATITSFWHCENVRSPISTFESDPDSDSTSISGGGRRRVESLNSTGSSVSLEPYTDHVD